MCLIVPPSPPASHPIQADAPEQIYGPIRREKFNDWLHRAGMAALRWVLLIGAAGALAWLIVK